MVTTSGKAIRTDRLRPLNTPREVVVEYTIPGKGGSTVASQYTKTDQTLAAGCGLSSYAIPHKVELHAGLKSIIAIREMWEIEDEWWRNHIARRYFDVVLDGGKHLILYQDRLTGKWYAQTP